MGRGAEAYPQSKHLFLHSGIANFFPQITTLCTMFYKSLVRNIFSQTIEREFSAAPPPPLVGESIKIILGGENLYNVFHEGKPLCYS